MKIKTLFLQIIILCSFISCEKNENQVNTDVAGTWKGSFSSDLIDNTDIMLIIKQDGNTISGNYYAERSVGTISGSVDGSKLTYTLTQTTSYCTGTFTGSGTISGESMSFSFQGTDCLGTHANGTGDVVKESSGTDLPDFTQLDLAGIWSGTASNSVNSFTLTLTVTYTGNVTGDGVNSTWTIDPMGTVNGGGDFEFISGSQLIVASASWNLQHNEAKQTLTGVFDVYVSGLHDLEITLVKQ